MLGGGKFSQVKFCSRCKCESLQRDNDRREIGHVNKEFFD